MGGVVVGIDKSLACVVGLRALALDAVELAKSGNIFTKIPRAIGLLSAIYSMAKQASEVMPEIDDLDSEEGAQLMQAVYKASMEFISALNKK